MKRFHGLAFLLLGIALILTSFSYFARVLADTTATLRPTADGGEDSASWTNTGSTACNATDCSTEVDESSGASCTNSDGNTTYIESSTNAASQTFDIDESSIPASSTITQIDITVCAIRGAGGAKIQTRRCVDGSCTSSGSDINLTTSYVETTQSHTGLSITKGAVTDIEIGVINGVAKAARVSQISATITYTPPDTTAPSSTTDLAVTSSTQTTVGLSWTAPGDDGNTGTATTYDVRYSTANITDANWSSASTTTGEPSPSVAGSTETFTVSSLTASTTYYFALKTSDEVPNESGLSNVVTTSTLASTDSTAPADTTDLSTTSSTASTITISWTAPGDDGNTGTATTYDVRYATTTISDGNWATSTQASGEPAPSVAGSTETFTISSLTASTTYYFALKTSDEVPNESNLSNVVTTSTLQTADTTAPSSTTDLAVTSSTASTLTVSWTAPGDDGNTGTANTYDVRYSTANITEGNWSSATAATGEPSPSVAGTTETFAISSLTNNTTYYVALKTRDEASNESDLSNVVSSSTLLSDDSTAPAKITDFAAGEPTVSAVPLSWTAPGDDGNTGTATTYDIRYSFATIASSTFAGATQVTGEPTPSVAGSAESMTVSGLISELTYYFAIKAKDEGENSSDISNIINAKTLRVPPGEGTFFNKTIALFSGLAYPDGTIEVYRRNRLDPPSASVSLVTEKTGEGGVFTVALPDLIFGDYLFTVRAIDKEGRSSGIVAFSPDFLLGNDTRLIAEGIFVPPTLAFEDSVVVAGQPVIVKGYATPDSKVEIELNTKSIGEAKVQEDGSYEFAIDTTGKEKKMYDVRVRQRDSAGRKSNYSPKKIFKISTLKNPKADFNNDNKIDITDWSVFLFRWGSTETAEKAKADMDGNGIINIADLSIFLKAMEL